MSEFRELPNVEKALVAWLKADSGVISKVVARVSTELPATFKAETRVQLFNRTSAPVDQHTEAIDRPVVQLNAFGKTKDEAFSVAVATSVAMRRLEGRTESGVVFGAIDRITGPQWARDPSTDIPRFILTFGVTAHT